MRTFTARQVAKRIGASEDYVYVQINRGRLKAGRSTIDRRAFEITAVDLHKWLMLCGEKPERIREILCPPGPLVLVRVAVAVASLIREPTIRLRGLFRLGVRLGQFDPWGVVVDLPAVGTSEACESLALLFQEPYRPFLIGLHGEDGAPAHAPFDLLLPADRSEGELAEDIGAARPRSMIEPREFQCPCLWLES